jgi:hypothetical protein
MVGGLLGAIAAPRLQGRFTLSPLVAGLLVQHVSSNWALGAFAVALGVSAILALTLKGLRQAEAAG